MLFKGFIFRKIRFSVQLWTKNVEKAYLDQHLKGAAPKHWSKFTTEAAAMHRDSHQVLQQTDTSNSGFSF